MIVILLIWAMVASMIAIVAVVDYSKYNHRLTKARKVLFEKASEDHERCHKVRVQRDVLYDAIKDQAKHWRPYHGKSIGLSKAYWVCEEIAQELDGR